MHYFYELAMKITNVQTIFRYSLAHAMAVSTNLSFSLFSIKTIERKKETSEKKDEKTKPVTV